MFVSRRLSEVAVQSIGPAPIEVRQTLAAGIGPRASLSSMSRDAEVAADKSAALSSPRFKPAETRKGQARARLQRLAEWLKIARKLYAENPRGMARVLAQAFKELKAALKDYKSAIGEELSLSGEVTHAVVDPAPAQAEAAASAEEAPPAAAQESSPSSPPDPAAARGASLYAAVESEVRKAIGEDGLTFIKDLRSFANEVHTWLESARIKAHGQRRDKATDEAFEDADKAAKSLAKEISDAEQDLHDAVPAAGMRLSVAA